MKNHTTLTVGALVSSGMLLLFMYLQFVRPEILQVPVQWLWASLVPILLGILRGGYILKGKAGSDGIEVEFSDKQLQNVPEVQPPNDPVELLPTPEWTSARQNEYERTRGYSLVHVCARSNEEGQVFDAFIFVVCHKKDSTRPDRTGFTNVKKAEFYLGVAWGNQVFKVENGMAEVLGVRVHAYGTFLATCKLSFSDGTHEILHRYVDCESLRHEK